MTADNSPCHAHIYFSSDERPAAEALRDRYVGQTGKDEEPLILFVGPLRDGPVGPHPLPQFEVHFPESSRAAMIAAIKESGLRALLHPLTDDDLADHTSLAHWIGEPLDLDLTVLDPPGGNKGVSRYGKTDF